MLGIGEYTHTPYGNKGIKPPAFGKPAILFETRTNRVISGGFPIRKKSTNLWILQGGAKWGKLKADGNKLVDRAAVDRPFTPEKESKIGAEKRQMLLQFTR